MADADRAGNTRVVKVAIVSADGKNIDEPFGCATRFFIYGVGEKIELLEVREAKPGHDHAARIDLISDCEILLTSKIGCDVVYTLFFSGIYPLVLRGEIPRILERLRPRVSCFRLRSPYHKYL
jgi:predicted Fe-Mo cluster-binding NifX family protein